MTVTVYQGRVFDRREQFDERSRAFPVTAVLEPAQTRKPRSYTWRVPGDVVLDQGREGACVGFAWTHELLARPATVPDLDASFARNHVYKPAQKIDEWEGEAYEGTSVLAGAKVCQQAGFIGAYRWAFGLDELVAAVGYLGPAVLGVPWYEGMFAPDGQGYLRPTGRMVGGHAILAQGVSVRHERVLLRNSWGPRWGNHGTAFISFADLDRLLSQGGDCCIPQLRKRNP